MNCKNYAKSNKRSYTIAMNKQLIQEILESDISLVAVTKMHTKEEVDQLAELGCTTFGENRVQEFLTKYDPKYSWHLIGHLQTNKVKYIIGKVDVIESVDSKKLAKEIDKYANKQNIIQDVFVEVKISKTDMNKSGIEPDQTLELIQYIQEELENVRCTGLMTIASNTDDQNILKQEFSDMRELYKSAKSKYSSISTLSMGMSQDWPLAIKYGSNQIRIGTALFK